MSDVLVCRPTRSTLSATSSGVSGVGATSTSLRPNQAGSATVIKHAGSPENSAGRRDVDSRTRTIVLPSLLLESGVELRDVPVAFATFGSLNRSGSNAVLVCHSLTSDARADRWWPGLIGPGRLIDTDRFFVICANVLGSPYGSASPLTTSKEHGRLYGPDFPDVTIRDTVKAHRRVLDALGVNRVALAIGGSMGGMQVLEWALQDSRIGAIAPVAVGAYHSPWCIAWSEAQRSAIQADPAWNAGRYAPDRPPAQGLAAARMMAMVSYRSPVEFRDRFGRTQAPNGDGFDVEGYLQHHGRTLVDRFDANCYVQLTRQMDTHDVGRNRGGIGLALSSIRQPAVVVGISSDVLYPLHEQQELAEGLPNADLLILDAPYGHDSFLVATDRLSSLLDPFLAKHVTTFIG